MSTVEPGWVWDGVISLDYTHAAYVLGVPVGWLKEKAPAENLPRSFYGKHVIFTPDDIREIRRMHSNRAEIAAVVAISGGDEYDARLRAALIAAERRSAA